MLELANEVKEVNPKTRDGEMGNTRCFTDQWRWDGALVAPWDKPCVIKWSASGKVEEMAMQATNLGLAFSVTGSIGIRYLYDENRQVWRKWALVDCPVGLGKITALRIATALGLVEPTYEGIDRQRSDDPNEENKDVH